MLRMLILVCSLALLARVLTMVTARWRPSRLIGWTVLMGLATVGIYASAAPFRLLAPAVALLWMSTLLLPDAVLRTRCWGPIGLRAAVASALLLTALVVATIPSTPSAHLPISLPAPVPSAQADAALSSLTRAGAPANPAAATLVHDYAMYHAVLVVGGGVAALLLLGLGVFCWRGVRRRRPTERRAWTFERKTYGLFGLVSTGSALVLLLIVAANLSNVLDPHAGLAHAFPVLGASQPDPHKAALHDSVATWAQAGSPAIPSLLHNAVQDRLMWQQPKAIVCGILLIAFAAVTARIWRHLIRHARVPEGMWGRNDKARLTMGVLAVPLTLLLMIMALANTQASFAPITLTLLFG